MKVQLESTTKLIMLNGIQCRVWEGATEAGIACFAFIPRIGIHQDSDASEFERDLQECRPLRNAEVESFPARMVL